jgi:GTP-binding protein Era
VTIDELNQREGKNMVDIHANVWVERDSQKGIIVGRGGDRIKDVGSKSRIEIEKLIGQKVFLNIRVKVAPDWQRDPKQLGRLGF